MNTAIKVFLANSIQKAYNFNKYHDKLGKFTWSPFGKYQGNAYAAESIYGKEYNNLIKNYDISQLTDDDIAMVEAYTTSVAFGNSGDKNRRYTKELVVVDKEGNIVSAEDAKKYEDLDAEINRLSDERYRLDHDLWNTPSDSPERLKLKEQQEKLSQQLSEKRAELEALGLQKKNIIVPDPCLRLPKLETLNKPDAFLTPDQLKSLEMRTLGKGNYDKFTSLDDRQQHDFREGWGNLEIGGKQYKEFTPEQQRAFDSIYRSAESARWSSYKPDQIFNDIKYGGNENYITTEIPGTATVKRDAYGRVTSVTAKNRADVGVSYAYIQSLPTSTLQAYSKRLSNYYNGMLDNIVKRELDSRKMDALIQAKGVSLPKDIVLTRRVQNTELMAQEIRSQGFYTQQGFTSTTAANNIAKKSPGNMVFGDNLLKIVVPAGTKVLPVEAVVKEINKRKPGTFESGILRQHEVLLPENTKYISTDQTRPNQLTNITDSLDQAKFSPTLELSKIDTTWSYDKGYRNEIYSMIAITEEYQKGK